MDVQDCETETGKVYIETETEDTDLHSLLIEQVLCPQFEVVGGKQFGSQCSKRSLSNHNDLPRFQFLESMQFQALLKQILKIVASHLHGFLSLSLILESVDDGSTSSCQHFFCKGYQSTATKAQAAITERGLCNRICASPSSPSIGSGEES